MGQKQKNVETVTDYADGRHFLRLHRDIVLPATACEAVRRHLSANRWAEAKQIALEHAPADAREEIELFFTATAERLADPVTAGVMAHETPRQDAS
ncbi:hypothetical protein GobsT_14160 [Gemmata obscuriglobus]|uniref:Uncharacterized protein n=1 Tax=Gemmata obscuriglobus TaxID=114 RepID=A0A2Z3H702_9BACT|nr:hypothetical protein [Gemmata obscuriglobus]AWM40152.1 hypothetical protein C1280_26200 [Gemmata obscuriglobus]QEG26671.1 hypothetical protein GobsT_14160 [Gemmata obscuriglobus]VTS02302.1 unnamed protein product [Gemmata obscuriglobus UQM 2246]